MLKSDEHKTEVPVALATVDCTIETNLSRKYDIQAFPTLKMFRNGGIYEFEGPRSDALGKYQRARLFLFNSLSWKFLLQAMIKYLKNEARADWKAPVSMVQRLTKDNFTEWTEKHNLSLVKFFIPG